MFINDHTDANGDPNGERVSDLVSVIVPSKNRPDCVRRLLESLRSQDYGRFEVIVVDDGSEPPLDPDCADVKVIRNDRSLGASAARNRGFKTARGAMVVYLDDDAEVADPHLITRAVALANSYPNCGAIAFRQLTAEPVPSYMQPAPGSERCYVGQFFSYGCLIRSDVLVTVGGFDEVFFYYEEIELGLRLMDAGYTIIYDPEVSVIHHHDERGWDYQTIYRQMLKNAILTALLRFPASYAVVGVVPPMVRHL